MTLSLVFEPTVRSWQKEILRWSQAREIDPNLVATVMQIESCGQPDALSGAGAMGLFQVMPFPFGSGENPFDPETNANRGLDYLQRSYQLAQGDLAKTLAGYNGGHSRIYQDPADWPQETRRYVTWGTGIMYDISQNLEKSPTLKAWLAAGGNSLCQKAQLASNQ